MAAVIMEKEYAGTIREIIFHNKENGYTVAVFESQRLAEDAAKPEEWCLLSQVYQMRQ